MSRPTHPAGLLSSYLRERGRLRLACYNYVATHPGCTARQVAASLFGTDTGRTSPERRAALYLLNAIEQRMTVVRDRSSQPHRWYDAASPQGRAAAACIPPTETSGK